MAATAAQRFGVDAHYEYPRRMRRLDGVVFHRLICVNAPRGGKLFLQETSREDDPMRAMDVMTTNVITVGPDASVQEVAKTLSERGISGVPVVDADNRLVGIVSEGDLLHRVEMGTERRPDRTRRRRSWWLDTIASDEELARDYVKSHGRTAKDVMTPEVISVSDTTELSEIATLLETKRIKRVPVVKDGQLVGIISRAADIIVRDRVVNIWVSDDRSSEERQALRVAAENIPGVRGVEEHLVPAPLIPPAF
jgi:CBS domain-containing protein